MATTLVPPAVCPCLIRAPWAPGSSRSPRPAGALPVPVRLPTRWRPSTRCTARQEESQDDFTTKKFQIAGFRPILKKRRKEAEGATEEEPLVSRRQAMMGAVAGVLAAAAGGAETEAIAETAAAEQFVAAPSGLGYKDTSEGSGAEPQKGQLIKAHYTGRLESNGKVFDSSYTRGRPLTFRIGAGEVIKGWDQGILGAEGIPPMKAGGKRTLRIPAELGYGSRAVGCRGGVCAIPSNSVLIFDVEFLGKASG